MFALRSFLTWAAASAVALVGFAPVGAAFAADEKPPTMIADGLVEVNAGKKALLVGYQPYYVSSSADGLNNFAFHKLPIPEVPGGPVPYLYSSLPDVRLEVEENLSLSAKAQTMACKVSYLLNCDIRLKFNSPASPFWKPQAVVQARWEKVGAAGSGHTFTRSTFFDIPASGLLEFNTSKFLGIKGISQTSGDGWTSYETCGSAGSWLPYGQTSPVSGLQSNITFEYNLQSSYQNPQTFSNACASWDPIQNGHYLQSVQVLTVLESTSFSAPELPRYYGWHDLIPSAVPTSGFTCSASSGSIIFPVPFPQVYARNIAFNMLAPGVIFAYASEPSHIGSQNAWRNALEACASDPTAGNMYRFFSQSGTGLPPYVPPVEVPEPGEVPKPTPPPPPPLPDPDPVEPNPVEECGLSVGCYLDYYFVPSQTPGEALDGLYQSSGLADGVGSVQNFLNSIYAGGECQPITFGFHPDYSTSFQPCVKQAAAIIKPISTVIGWAAVLWLVFTYIWGLVKPNLDGGS